MQGNLEKYTPRSGCVFLRNKQPDFVVYINLLIRYKTRCNRRIRGLYFHEIHSPFLLW